MKILLAPDSYKECLSSREVAAVMAAAVSEVLPACSVVSLPLADGGEGTLDVWVHALGGTLQETVVSDPLGRPVPAQFGLAGETAFIEVARACGLALLAPSERHPLETSTYGVGELLLAACSRGCKRIVMGLGGSATCDGGEGMMRVGGLREALQGVEIELLCDVDAPFVGPLGAARVFGPQKGATPDEVEALERRMLERAAVLAAETGLDVSRMPGAGAAGGLGGALMAFFGARYVSGIDRILSLTGFDAAVADASLVITGEGRSDLQTLQGKVAMGVLRRSGAVPVALVSGCIEDAEALRAAGFRYLQEVSPRTLPLVEALRPEIAREHLYRAVGDLLTSWIK